MNTENPKPNYDGQRTVLLPGGLPDTKPMPEKKPTVRMPQISNADDLKAIQRNREYSAQIEPLIAGLRRLLIHNLEYVTHTREFLKLLADEINENSPDDAA